MVQDSIETAFEKEEDEYRTTIAYARAPIPKHA